MARNTCQGCGCVVARGDAHLRTVLATDTTRFLELRAWCPSCYDMLDTCTFGACDRLAVMRVRTRKPAGSGHMTTDSFMCQRHSDMVTSWGDHGGSYEYVAEPLS